MEEMVFPKIDAHSHFGRDLSGFCNKHAVYIPNALNIGVRICIVSPSPTPEVEEDGAIKRPCVWQPWGDGVRYVEETVFPGQQKTEREARRNPYQEINRKFIAEIRGINERQEGIVFFPALLHHPLLDTKKEVEFLAREGMVALKVHGISTFTGPNDMNPEVVEMAKEKNFPFIVHTDLYRGETKTLMQRACNLNHPYDWVRWAARTGASVLFTHGLRLCERAIEEASQLPNIKVGIAPDILLNSRPERLARDVGDYLEVLLSAVPVDKLVFDIDFGWNIRSRSKIQVKDWNTHKRIKRVAEGQEFAQDQLRKIFFANALDFYNIAAAL